MNCSRWSTSTPNLLSCVLPRLSPVGEDVPDDAVVPLADKELEGALLSRVAAARRAPASRARGKLDATSRDEGAEPQDFFVSQSAMRLPAAGRAHARDERSDRADVFSRGTSKETQVLFERPSPSLSVLKIKRRACPQQYCNYINGGLITMIN